MNRKLLVLGLALLIIGLVTLPLASAQFGGGDSDNNDGSTDSGSSDGGTDSDSDTSSGSDSTEDSESTSDDSTDDSNYDGGDAQNNEEETSDTDTSDNTTDDQQTSSDSETSYDGGDSQNNEEENSTNTNYDGGDAENNDNETNFDGGDAENNENETSFDGGDAENNEEETDDQQENTTSSEDDASEDQNTDPDSDEGSDNTESNQTDGDEDSPSDSPDTGSDDDDSDGGGFSPTNYIIEAVSQNSLQAEIDPETIQIGERSTVSGTLTGDDISNKQIEILVDGQKTTAFTNEDGEFEKEVTPTTVGDKDINVKQDDLEESLSLKVTPTVRIFSMHTSLERSPGETIEVCADITSQADAELTLYQNDQTHNSKSGQGELCFNPTLEQGENQFQAVAVVEGDRDEEEITRSAHTYNDETTTLGPSTGSFLSSTTGIVAGVGILTAIIGGIIAKRRGINPLGPLT